jgi:hypothetical protein
VEQKRDSLLLPTSPSSPSTWRLFTIGLGDSVSRGLVEGLARSGGGTFNFISLQDDIEAKIINQLKQSLKPSLEITDIENLSSYHCSCRKCFNY